MDNMHPVMAQALEAARPPLYAEIDRLRAKLDAILAAYDKALLAPKAAIPTILHAAIEAARK